MWHTTRIKVGENYNFIRLTISEHNYHCTTTVFLYILFKNLLYLTPLERLLI